MTEPVELNPEAMVDAAEALCMEGEYATSLMLAAAGVGLLDGEVGDTRSLEARGARIIAVGHQSLGHLDRAALWAERAITIGERIRDDEPAGLGAALHTRAIIQLEKGQLREALPRLSQAAELLEGAGDEYRAEFQAVMLTLAEASLATGDHESAQSLFEKVLEDVGDAGEAQSEEHADALNGITAKALLGLGGAHAQAGDNMSAKDFLARSIEFFDAAFGHNHPEMVAALTEVSSLYRLVGDEAAADAIDEELRVAARLLAEAEASFTLSRPPPAPDESVENEPDV